MPKTSFMCCICQTEEFGFGNNPDPFSGERCCDDCNDRWVIPARMVFGRGTKVDLRLFLSFARLGRRMSDMHKASNDLFAAMGGQNDHLQ